MSNTIKKIIPYLLILAVMVGIFGVEKIAVAESPDDMGICTAYGITGSVQVKRSQCSGTFQVGGATGSTETYEACEQGLIQQGIYDFSTCNGRTGDPAKNESPLGKAISDYGCISLTNGFDGCLVKLVYYLFYSIPSFFLNLIANLFNLVIPLALNSAMYSGSFIANTWVIVRDLSNMFFILVLLYIAIELILGLAHDAKKMITRVIVMALLINFSMFFTTVVIDSSNILALIFYNKMDINSTVIDVNGKETTRFYTPMLKNGTIDKDVSGGLVYKFDPTKFLTPEFFDKATKEAVAVPTSVGSVVRGAGTSIAIGAAVGNVTGAILGGIVYGLSFLGSPRVPPAIMIGILITSGLIMMFAIWAFFVASISFIGRIIELWVLIIFSPFAFMSSTIPILERVSYIGWEEWSKRLLKTSFMAPIFMFFMYVIFKISNTNIWNDFAATGNRQLIPSMLFLLLPGLIILVLLQQATKFAKEGGGKFADVFVGLAKVAGGLGVGFTAGLAAKGLQASAGSVGKKMFNSSKLIGLENTEGDGWRDKWNRYRGSKLRDMGYAAYTSSFDARKGLGDVLGKVGIKGIGQGEAGGKKADEKRTRDKRNARADALNVNKGEEISKKLRAEQNRHQALLNRDTIDTDYDTKEPDGSYKQEKVTYEQRIARLVGRIKHQEEALKQAQEESKINPQDEALRLAANKASTKLKDLQGEKGAITKGLRFVRKSDGQIIDESQSTVDESGEAVSAREVDAAKTGVVTTEAEKVRAERLVIDTKEEAKTADDDVVAKNKAVEDTNYDLARAQALASANPTDDLLIKASADALIKKTKADEALANAVKKQKEATEKATKAIEKNKAAEEASQLALERKTAVDEKLAINGNKTSLAISDMENTVIPKIKEEIARISKNRIRAYANNIEKARLPWDRFDVLDTEEREITANELRMGVKSESHGDQGDHGGGSHLKAALGAELIVEIGEKLFTGGSGGGGGGGAKKADAGHH